MPLTIKTTGVEDYVTGDGRIKMLVIGGPGVGKTRMSSFWPRPIYADTEGGRGSLADRNVPYVEVKSSQDMLDFLTHLKEQERLPRERRPYDTVVIDTLDGFQRKVIDERLQQTKKQAFSGWDDWGYLDSKLQMLLTRLLNLDLNVLVLVHYKDKTIGTGDDARTEVALQLKGDIANSVANDFDLIGRLGTYWEAVEGERVEKRGLTFKKTPEWPQLKDRFGVMKAWTPVTLTSDTDYTFIREAFQVRLDELKAGEVVGEIASGVPEDLPGPGVVAPTGGPVPPQDPREVPLHQFDKATLQKMCRDAKPPITTTIDGQPLKGNSLKSEIVQAIELRRAQDAGKVAKPADEPAPAQSDAASASPEPGQPEPVTPDVPTSAEVTAAIPEQRTEEPTPDALATAVEAASGLVEAPVDPEPTPAVEPAQLVEQPVDTNTGEIAPATLTGDVVDAPVVEVPSADTPAEIPSVPTTADAEAGPRCEEEGCDVVLSTQSPDWVKLSFIRFKKRLCGAHYQEARAAAQG